MPSRYPKTEIKALSTLTAQTYQTWSRVFGKNRSIPKKLDTLKLYLSKVLAEVRIGSALLAHYDGNFSKLLKLMANCTDLVKYLDNIAAGYEPGTSASRRTNWHHLQLEFDDQNDPLKKLDSQVIALRTYVDAIGIGALESVEEGDLPSMIQKIDNLVAEVRAGRHPVERESYETISWDYIWEMLKTERFSAISLLKAQQPLRIYFQKSSEAGLLYRGVLKEDQDQVSGSETAEETIKGNAAKRPDSNTHPKFGVEASNSEEEIQPLSDGGRLRTPTPTPGGEKYNYSSPGIRRSRSARLDQASTPAVEPNASQMKGDNLSGVKSTQKSKQQSEADGTDVGVEDAALNEARLPDFKDGSRRQPSDRSSNGSERHKNPTSPLPTLTPLPSDPQPGEWWYTTIGLLTSDPRPIYGDVYECEPNWQQQTPWRQRSLTYEALPSSEFYPVKSDPVLPEGWDWWVDAQNRIFYIDEYPAQGRRRCFWQPPIAEIFPNERPPPEWSRVESLFGRISWLHVPSGRRCYSYPTCNKLALFRDSSLGDYTHQSDDAYREQRALNDQKGACQISHRTWNNGVSNKARRFLGLHCFTQKDPDTATAYGERLTLNRNKWLDIPASVVPCIKLWHILPFCTVEQSLPELPPLKAGYCWRSKHGDTRCMNNHVCEETLKAYWLDWHHVDGRNYVVIRRWISELDRVRLVKHTDGLNRGDDMHVSSKEIAAFEERNLHGSKRVRGIVAHFGN